jgi:hypothetical protein
VPEAALRRGRSLENRPMKSPGCEYATRFQLPASPNFNAHSMTTTFGERSPLPSGRPKETSGSPLGPTGRVTPRSLLPWKPMVTTSGPGGLTWDSSRSWWQSGSGRMKRASTTGKVTELNQPRGLFRNHTLPRLLPLHARIACLKLTQTCQAEPQIFAGEDGRGDRD